MQRHEFVALQEENLNGGGVQAKARTNLPKVSCHRDHRRGSRALETGEETRNGVRGHLAPSVYSHIKE
jgi:hypothetical protein